MQNALKYTIFKTRWGYFGLACCDSASRARNGTSRQASARRAGNENGLLRTCLPLNNAENVKSRFLTCLTIGKIISEAPRFEKQLFKTVQEQITAYFEGACVNFSVQFSHQDTKSQRNQIYKEKTSSLGAFVAKNVDIPVVLDGLSDFCISVLTACRDIKFGQTASYLELAKKLGRANAVRAVGNALSKNPLPLIIPCHRVIRTNGKIGGFSAPGGTDIKARLLKHEQQMPIRCKSD